MGIDMNLNYQIHLGSNPHIIVQKPINLFVDQIKIPFEPASLTAPPRTRKTKMNSSTRNYQNDQL
jgi:hypothetical protein